MEKLAQHPEYAKLARELKNQGFGYREIAKQLSDKGFEISYQGIKNYIDALGGVEARLINEDDQLATQAKEEILNTMDQLRKVNEETWQLISDLKVKTEDPKSGLYASSLIINALDKISKQIELSNKIAGRIHGNQTVNISYLDYSMNIQKNLKIVAKDMERRGIIKVLREDLL